MCRIVVKIFRQVWGFQPTGQRTLIAGLALALALILMPTGYEDAVIYIASEILQTLAGSFALVTVAPFTAVTGGLLLSQQRKLIN